jgi:hypothetical protein
LWGEGELNEDSCVLLQGAERDGEPAVPEIIRRSSLLDATETGKLLNVQMSLNEQIAFHLKPLMLFSA